MPIWVPPGYQPSTYLQPTYYLVPDGYLEVESRLFCAIQSSSQQTLPLSSVPLCLLACIDAYRPWNPIDRPSPASRLW